MTQTPRPPFCRTKAAPLRIAPALALALLVLVPLAGCGTRPAAPDWEMNAHASATKATEAYLSGDTRIAELEWTRARAEIARTGRPDLLARRELMRCAAQHAALDWQPCSAFEALRADAEPGERAYADYLTGRFTPGDSALLPPAQRKAAVGGASALAGTEDPLSRLVAASVVVAGGSARADAIALAVKTASDRGWRRPLLAWLGLQRNQAQAAGNSQEAAALQRRIDLIELKGAPGL